MYKGAHMKCHSEYCRKMAAAKRGANKCRRCWVVIQSGIKLCSDCATASRKEALARYEAKRKQRKVCGCGCGGELRRGFTGRFLAGHNPRLKQPRKRVNRRAVAQKDATKKARADFKRERPFAEPRKPVIDQPPTNPRGIEPRRIEPVGAAAWSAADARRWG